MDKKYYIYLPNGKKAMVNEDIYRAFKQPVWREQKRRKQRREKEVSLESIEETPITELTEQIVEDRLMLELLMEALAALTEGERELINEIYFQEKTERDISNMRSVSHQAIHKQKNRILKNLEKF